MIHDAPHTGGLNPPQTRRRSWRIFFTFRFFSPPFKTQTWCSAVTSHPVSPHFLRSGPVWDGPSSAQRGSLHSWRVCMLQTHARDLRLNQRCRIRPNKSFTAGIYSPECATSDALSGEGASLVSRYVWMCAELMLIAAELENSLWSPRISHDKIWSRNVHSDIWSVSQQRVNSFDQSVSSNRGGSL